MAPTGSSTTVAAPRQTSDSRHGFTAGYSPTAFESASRKITSIGIDIHMKEAVREYKFRWRDLVLPESSIDFWQDSMKCGCIQTREVLQRAPDITGLVVDTIPGAIGALRAVAESGRRCPDDVSIVTALSYAGIEEYTFPSLSSVVVSNEKISRTALDAVLGEDHSHSREFVIDMEFIARESIRNLNGE